MGLWGVPGIDGFGAPSKIRMHGPSELYDKCVAFVPRVPILLLKRASKPPDYKYNSPSIR